MFSQRCRWNFVRTLLVITALCGSAPSLHACECTRIGRGSACEKTGKSDAVFLGKVLRISRSTQRDGREYFLRNHVTFEILESFRGETTRTVEIVTGTGGGDCGVAFENGRQYLVYASKSSGSQSLSTSICSGTITAERAASDLVYLRSLAKGGPSSRIFGFVTGYHSFIGIDLRFAYKAPIPIANVPIHLESRSTTKQTMTDSTGAYTFDGLSSGEFTLSADMPNNLGGGETRTIKLQDHACSEQILIAVERARLSGRVLDDHQRPSVTTPVSLVSTRTSTKAGVFSDYTYRGGFFTIPRVPPGDYVLGVNISQPPNERDPFQPTYFPGVSNRAQAKIIHIESGQELSGFELRLPPPLRPRMITGTVTWPDGKTALGAFVELKDSEFADTNVDLGRPTKDGVFTVTGVEGRSYSLSAVVGIREGQQPFHSETVRLKPNENGPIHLVLSLRGR